MEKPEQSEEAQADTETEAQERADSTVSEEQETQTTETEDSNESSSKKTLIDDEGDSAEQQEEVEYELELSEESLLSDESLDDVKEFAKENNLTNEVAQAILKSHEQVIGTYKKGQEEAAKKQFDDWYDEVEGDKDFGQDNFKKSQELSKRILNKYADDSFKAALKETGFINHPGLFKFVVRMGRDVLSEDKMIESTSSSPVRELSDEELWYGQQEK